MNMANGPLALGNLVVDSHQPLEPPQENRAQEEANHGKERSMQLGRARLLPPDIRKWLLAVFQALVNDALRDFINHFVFVYVDDILIFSKSRSEHKKHVRQVLEQLLENHLFVKGEKCGFHVQSVSFLRVIVEQGSFQSGGDLDFDLSHWNIIFSQQIGLWRHLTSYQRARKA
ncbi:hypothetical protein ACER0C_017226 [Sarotherodon galilaeus]